MKKLSLLIMTLPFFVISFTALAKTDHARKHREEIKQEATLSIAISSGDRIVIRDYLRDHYRPHCPPGLAKKHNGCLPPGIAKKYAMGKSLPPGLDYQPLPDDLLARLHPVNGYQYVQVDKDVLLVSEATKHVADAITLLSALD